MPSLRIIQTTCLTALLAGLFTLKASAAELVFPIAADAFMDSRPANAAFNYGAATTLKTLVNSSDGTVCRGLFQLPPELALFDPADIVSANVQLYVWQDNTGERNITLYPLTRPFSEGSKNGSGIADGATWNTFDGTNAWNTAGGDVDTNFPVVGVKEEILNPDMHDRFFSWNLAPLLADPAARSNLLAHGALIQIDELPVPSSGTPRAPFTSSDDLNYTAAYRPHLDLDVVLRTPELPQISIADGTLNLDLANLTPFVTHRIEYTQNLHPTNGWTTLTNVVSTGSATNWTGTLPADWPQAFYRIVAVP